MQSTTLRTAHAPRQPGASQLRRQVPRLLPTLATQPAQRLVQPQGRRVPQRPMQVRKAEAQTAQEARVVRAEAVDEERAAQAAVAAIGEGQAAMAEGQAVNAWTMELSGNCWRTKLLNQFRCA